MGQLKPGELQNLLKLYCWQLTEWGFKYRFLESQIHALPTPHASIAYKRGTRVDFEGTQWDLDFDSEHLPHRPPATCVLSGPRPPKHPELQFHHL